MKTKLAVTILATAMLSSCSGLSEHRLLIPLATVHTHSNDELNNQNYGIGYEHHSNNINTSILWLKENSYERPSVYGAITYEFKENNGFKVLMGGALGNGYEDVTDSGWIATSVMGVEFNNFRVITSAPFSTLFHPKENEIYGDFIMLLRKVRF